MGNFVFYKDWIKNIKDLPIDIQDKIIADIVRYGVGEEMAHDGEATIQMAVNFTKRAIDDSKAKYKAKIEYGKNHGKAKKTNDKEIYDLAREGLKSAEIAEILGVSKSSVDHSDGWRQRKNDLAF
jgi:DNA-binding NarL/FixJ family response regulator